MQRARSPGGPAVIGAIGRRRPDNELAAGSRCRKRARWCAVRPLVVAAPGAAHFRRTVTAVALGVSLVQSAGAARAVAQDSVQTAPRHRRSTIYAIAGAVLGGVAGVLFSKAGGSPGHGGCGVPCFSIASAAAGGGIGYLIGRQSDRRYALRYRGGIGPLDIRTLTAPLGAAPTAIAVAAGDVAVAGSAGVQLFNSDSGLRLQAVRAGGLHRITHVALAPESGWLVAGSPSGLYLFPPGRGPGALAHEGDVSAVAAASTRAFVALPGELGVVPLSLAEDTLVSLRGTPVSSAVSDLQWDAARALLWAVTDRDLLAFRATGDSLVRVGGAALGGAGLRLALSGDTVAVALGTGGVRLFDAHDPAAPVPILSWTHARFAYDVALDGGRLFIAAGPEGVFVIELRARAPRALGVARGLGFVTALASDRGYTYILDRRTNSLRRILSRF